MLFTHSPELFDPWGRIGQIFLNPGGVADCLTLVDLRSFSRGSDDDGRDLNV